MIALLRKIKQRGVRHSFETLFNRVVPAWLFRFSAGKVLELDMGNLTDTWNGLDSDVFTCRCVEDAAERENLRAITWNSVPLSSSANDFGYSISRAGEEDVVLGGVWGGIESFLEADLGFQIQLDPKQAWLYCAYVNKDARGGGVYKRVFAFAGKDLQERGYEQLLVIIQPWNHASMYVHKKYATREIGHIIVVRILRLACVFRTGSITKNGTFTMQVTANPVLIQIPK